MERLEHHGVEGAEQHAGAGHAKQQDGGAEQGDAEQPGGERHGRAADQDLADRAAGRAALNATIIWLGLAFLWLPVLLLVLYAFSADPVPFRWGGLSLRWFRELAADERLLEAARATGARPRFVFTSSLAVFGSAVPTVVPEDLATQPESTYGATKAIGELLVNEYSRKGYVDGRVCRLPTISVRPGKPNSAAATFEWLSGRADMDCTPPATTRSAVPLITACAA